MHRNDLRLKRHCLRPTKMLRWASWKRLSLKLYGPDVKHPWHPMPDHRWLSWLATFQRRERKGTSGEVVAASKNLGRALLGRDIEDDLEMGAEELSAHWAKASIHMQQVRPDQLKAWVERKKLEAGRFDTESFKQRKNRLMAISATSLAVSWVGLIPDKIPFLDNKIENVDEVSFLVLLLIAEFFAYSSYLVEIRQFILGRSFLELTQRADGTFSEIENSWTQYVEANLAELRGYYREFAKWIAVLTILSLLISIARRIWRI